MWALNVRFRSAFSVLVAAASVLWGAGAYGDSFSGIQVQNVSNTQTPSIEVTYFAPPAINSQGHVSYTALLNDGSQAIRFGARQDGGGYEIINIADTSALGQFSSFEGAQSLTDGNHVTFAGVGKDDSEGIWQGSVVIQSTGTPTAVVQNVDNSLDSTRFLYFWPTGANNGEVTYTARDSNNPATPLIYRGFDQGSGFEVQNIDTSAVDVTIAWYQNTNNGNDTVLEGMHQPSGGTSRQVIAVVNPSDPSRNAIVTGIGDSLGDGLTVEGFNGSAVISSSGVVAAIVNVTGDEQVVARYEPSESGGTTVYTPIIMQSTGEGISGFNRVSIVNTGQTDTTVVHGFTDTGGEAIYATIGGVPFGSAILSSKGALIVRS